MEESWKQTISFVNYQKSRQIEYVCLVEINEYELGRRAQGFLQYYKVNLSTFLIF